MEVPNISVFDSVHSSILMCCNSYFLRHLFLGCTGLWFMTAGDNESDFQHLAFGGLRNSCDSQRGFTWSISASPWAGPEGQLCPLKLLFCVVAVQMWPSLLSRHISWHWPMCQERSWGNLAKSCGWNTKSVTKPATYGISLNQQGTHLTPCHCLYLPCPWETGSHLWLKGF